MELWTGILLGVVGLVVGGAVAFALAKKDASTRREEAELEARTLKERAELDAERIRSEAELSARDELLKLREEHDRRLDKEREKLRERERAQQTRETALSERDLALEKRQRMLQDVEDRVAKDQNEIRTSREEAVRLLEERRAQLADVAGMTAEQATTQLLETIRADVAEEEERLIAKSEENIRATVEERSRDIVSTAVQRIAASHTSEITVSPIDIPNDDIKGRIIGREGRNIRAFEKAAGVDVIVDDTPGVVLVSAFDGVRRETARRAMNKLVKDGRTHPARIEEVVRQTAEEVEEDINETGRRTVMELNIGKLHPKLVHLLGRLKFRTSYGQNVLQHSIEAAHVCGLMCAELGLDERLGRRCGLLHDIGKSIDHEV